MSIVISGALTKTVADGKYAAAEAVQSGLLRWAPPIQSNPTVVNVPVGYYTGTFGASEDVVFIWPGTARTGSFDVTGGRHVRIIGGKSAKTTTGAAVRFVGVTGSVFIEGMEIDASGYNGDAFNLCGVQTPGAYTYPDIYLQNCRVTGVNGTLSTNHADIFQSQGPIGRLFVDKFTGRSGYQGFLIGPQFPVSEAHFSRIDLGYEPSTNNITYLLWLFGLQELPYPVTLDEVYVQPKTGQTLADAAIAPWNGTVSTNPKILGQAVGAIADATGATWPTVAKTSGRVTSGAPPRGDFVPTGSVGLGYVAKGYRSHAPALVDPVPLIEAFTSGAVPTDITIAATSKILIDNTVGNPAPSLQCVTASSYWWGNTGSRWHAVGDFTYSYDLLINPDGSASRDIYNQGFWCNNAPTVDGFALQLQAGGGTNDAGWLGITAGTRTHLAATGGSGPLYNAGALNDLAVNTWHRVTISATGTAVTASVVRLSDSAVLLSGFTLDLGNTGLAVHIDGTHLASGVFGKAQDGAGSTAGSRIDNIAWTTISHPAASSPALTQATGDARYDALGAATTVSTALTTHSNLTTSAHGGIRSSTGHCYSVEPRQAAGPAAWPSANRALFFRLIGGKVGATKYRIYVGVASGNISLACYANTGSGPTAAPGAPITGTATGAIACPVAGVQTITMTGADIPDGAWVGLSCDNVTATFSKASSAQDATMVAGLLAAQSGGHPVPSVAPSGLFGVTTPYYVAIE